MCVFIVIKRLTYPPVGLNSTYDDDDDEAIVRTKANSKQGNRTKPDTVQEEAAAEAAEEFGFAIHSLKTADANNTPAYEQVTLQTEPVDEVVNNPAADLYSSPQDALKARIVLTDWTSEESQYASPQLGSDWSAHAHVSQPQDDSMSPAAHVTASAIEESQYDTPAGQSVVVVNAQVRDLYSKIDPTRRSSTKKQEDGDDVNAAVSANEPYGDTQPATEQFEGFGQVEASGSGREIMPLPAADGDSVKYASIADRSLTSGYNDVTGSEGLSSRGLYEEVKPTRGRGTDAVDFAPPSSLTGSRGMHYAELTFKAADPGVLPDKPLQLEPEDELLV